VNIRENLGSIIAYVSDGDVQTYVIASLICGALGLLVVATFATENEQIFIEGSGEGAIIFLPLMVGFHYMCGGPIILGSGFDSTPWWGYWEAYPVPVVMFIVGIFMIRRIFAANNADYDARQLRRAALKAKRSAS
jgi:hypothetical protein